MPDPDRVREALADLEAYKEALEASGEWDESDTDAVALVVLRLWLEGTEIRWCEEHNVQPDSWHRGNVEEGGQPCRIVSRRLVGGE